MPIKKIISIFWKEEFNYESALEQEAFERAVYVLANRNPLVPGHIQVYGKQININTLEIYSRIDYITARNEYYTTAKAKLSYQKGQSHPKIELKVFPGDMYIFLFWVIFPLSLVMGLVFYFTDIKDTEKEGLWAFPLVSTLILIFFTIKLAYEKNSLKKDIEDYFQLRTLAHP